MSVAFNNSTCCMSSAFPMSSYLQPCTVTCLPSAMSHMTMHNILNAIARMPFRQFPLTSLIFVLIHTVLPTISFSIDLSFSYLYTRNLRFHIYIEEMGQVLYHTSLLYTLQLISSQFTRAVRAPRTLLPYMNQSSLNFSSPAATLTDHYPYYSAIILVFFLIQTDITLACPSFSITRILISFAVTLTIH